MCFYEIFLAVILVKKKSEKDVSFSILYISVLVVDGNRINMLGLADTGTILRNLPGKPVSVIQAEGIEKKIRMILYTIYSIFEED